MTAPWCLKAGPHQEFSMASDLPAHSPSRPLVKYISHHHKERTETLDRGLKNQVGDSQREKLGRIFWTKADKPEIYQSSWTVLEKEPGQQEPNPTRASSIIHRSAAFILKGVRNHQKAFIEKKPEELTLMRKETNLEKDVFKGFRNG